MKESTKIFVMMVCVASLSICFANPTLRSDNDQCRPVQRYDVKEETLYRPALRQGGVLFVEDVAGTFGPPTQPDPVWTTLLNNIVGNGNYGWWGPTLTPEEDGPSYDTLVNHTLVIWNIYDYWWTNTPALTVNDQNNLGLYMSNGGKVWLIGQDAIFSGISYSWLSIYFHLQGAVVDYWWECPGANVQGLSEIAGFACYNVPDYAFNPFFPDELIPDASAHGVLEDTDSSKVVGIFYPGAGDWMSAFWAMDLRTCTPPSQQESMVYGMLDAFGVLGIQEKPEQEPARALYLSVTPDPVVRSASISYVIPVAGDVKMQVYNRAGQLINTLVDAYKQAGSYTVTWNARDAQGVDIPNGVYFVRLTCGELACSENIVLMK
jgi:hypothetical protein